MNFFSLSFLARIFVFLLFSPLLFALDLQIENETVTSTTSYQTDGVLTAQNVSVEPGGSLTLLSATKVVLGNGFHAKTGSLLTANIAAVGAPSPAPLSLTLTPDFTSPTNQPTLTFQVTSANVVQYRYQLDGNAFSSPTSISTPLILTSLSSASHTLLVIGRGANGLWQAPVDGVSFYWIQDQIPPSLSFALNPTPNPAGWNKVNTTLTFSATDTQTAIASLTSPILIDSEGSGQTFSGTALDQAGNSVSLTATVHLDKTAPLVTLTSPLPNGILEDLRTPILLTTTDTLSGSDTSSLQIQMDAAPVAGLASLNGTQITFTPSQDWPEGNHTLSLTLNDLAGNQSTLTGVPFSVALNYPPVAVNDTAVTWIGTKISIASVLQNDSDPDGDDLAITSFTQTANGTLMEEEDGVFTYTPNNGFIGNDPFTYIVNDGHGHSATGTVTLTTTQAPALAGEAHDIVIDENGNRYVVGRFGQSVTPATVDMNPGPGVDNKTSAGATDNFVTKYNSAGVYQWTQTFGGTGAEGASGTRVAYDSGKLYVCGTFASFNAGFGGSTGSISTTSQPVIYGPYGAVYNASNDAFVLCLDSATGNPVTSFGNNSSGVQIFGGSDDDTAYCLAVANGTVFMVGKFSSTDATIRGNPTIYNGGVGGTDLFVLALDSVTGQAKTSFGANGVVFMGFPGHDEEARGVAVLGQTVYVAGTMNGVGPFGFNRTPGFYTTNYGKDALVIALDVATGTPKTGFGKDCNNDSVGDGLQFFGGTEQPYGVADFGTALAVGNGTVYLAGYFGTSNAGVGQLGVMQSESRASCYILALDPGTGLAKTGFGMDFNNDSLGDGLQRVRGGGLANAGIHQSPFGLSFSGNTLLLTGRTASNDLGIGTANSGHIAGQDDAFLAVLDTTTGLARNEFSEDGLITFGGTGAYGAGNEVFYGAALWQNRVYVVGVASGALDMGFEGKGTLSSTLLKGILLELDLLTGDPVGLGEKPDVRSFLSTPPVILPGQQSSVSWTVWNVNRIESSIAVWPPASYPYKGSLTVTPASTLPESNYYITVFGPFYSQTLFHPVQVNKAPAVNIVTPVSGASFTAPDSVFITVGAGDYKVLPGYYNAQGVWQSAQWVENVPAKLELFEGTRMIASATNTQQIQFEWQSVPPGDYTLTAKTTDSDGFSTTSAPVNISVTPALDVSPLQIPPQIDLPIPGPSPIPDFTRFYAHTLGYKGPLGVGWSHSFNLTLLPQSNGNVFVRDETLNLVRFYLQPDGTYQTEKGERRKLVKEPGNNYRMSTPESLSYLFNASGELQEISNLQGRKILLTHGNGILTQAVTSAGQQLLFTYNTALPPQLIRVADAYGHDVQYGYGGLTGLVQLESVEDPTGRQTAYGYSNGYLVSVLNPEGWATNFTLNLNHNNLTEEKRNDDAFKTKVGRDGLTPQYTLEDSLGNIRTYEYNGSYRITQITHPDGGVESFDFNGLGDLTSETRENSGAWTYAVNADGQRTLETDPLQNVTATEYDPVLRLPTRITDPLLHDTVYTYNAQGNPLTWTNRLNKQNQYNYDSAGNLTEWKNPLLQSTRYEYDAQQFPVKTIDPLLHETTYQWTQGQCSAQTDPLQHTWSFGYDARSRLNSLTDPNGNNIQLERDSNGDLTKMTDALGFESSWTYFAPGKPAVHTNALNNKTVWYYDKNGNPTSVYTPLGQYALWEYDNRNRLTKTSLPGGSTLQYAYTNNLLTQITDPLQNLLHRGYDLKEQLTSVEFPTGNNTVYTHTANGKTASVTRPDSQAAAFTYDAEDQLTQAQYPGGKTLTQTYDDAGRLLSVQDSQTGTISHEYDAAGQRIKTTFPAGLELRSEYNARGDRTRLNIPGKLDFRYQYQSNGLLSAIQDGAGTTLVSLEYDGNGRVIEKQFQNGLSALYTRDALGRVIRLVYQLSESQVLETLDYTCNEDNQVARVTRNGVDTLFTYDAKGQLFDAVKSSGDRWSYSFDKNGNRLSSVENNQTSAFTVSPDNQYASVGGFALQYDDCGRLISKSTPAGTWTYTYDFDNHLTRVTLPLGGGGQGEGVIDFTYSPEGRLLSKTNASGATTNYLWDGEHCLAETDTSGNILRAYAFAEGDPLLMLEGSTLFNYLSDPQGSVLSLQNGSGVLEGFELSPFGSLQTSPSATGNPFYFAGALRDADTGLYFMGGRAFDPTLGRFLTPSDPQTLLGQNPYTYANNDPVNFTQHQESPVPVQGLHSGLSSLALQGPRNIPGIAASRSLLFSPLLLPRQFNRLSGSSFHPGFPAPTPFGDFSLNDGSDMGPKFPSPPSSPNSPGRGAGSYGSTLHTEEDEPIYEHTIHLKMHVSAFLADWCNATNFDVRIPGAGEIPYTGGIVGQDGRINWTISTDPIRWDIHLNRRTAKDGTFQILGFFAQVNHTLFGYTVSKIIKNTETGEILETPLYAYDTALSAVLPMFGIFDTQIVLIKLLFGDANGNGIPDDLEDGKTGTWPGGGSDPYGGFSGAGDGGGDSGGGDGEGEKPGDWSDSGAATVFLDGTPSPLVLPTQGNLERMSLTTDFQADNRAGNDIKVNLFKGQLQIRSNLIPAIQGPGVDGCQMAVAYSYYSNEYERGWKDNLICRVTSYSDPPDPDTGAPGPVHYLMGLPNGRSYAFKELSTPFGSIFTPEGSTSDNKLSTLVSLQDGGLRLTTPNGTRYDYQSGYLVQIQDRLGNELHYTLVNDFEFSGGYRVSLISEHIKSAFGTTPTGRSIAISRTVSLDASFTKTVTSTYTDPLNRVTKAIQVLNPQGHGSMTFQYPGGSQAVYTLQNHLVTRIKDLNDNLTTVSYLKDPIRQLKIPSPVDPTILEPQDLYYVQSVQDSRGKVFFERQARTSSFINALRFPTAVNLTDMGGRRYTYQFMGMGQTKSRKTFDNSPFGYLGSKTESFIWLNNGEGNFLRKYTDWNGVSISHAFIGGNPISQTIGKDPGDSLTTLFEYDDDFDILVKKTDPLGRVWERVLDPDNGLTTEIRQPDGTKKTFTYGSDNQLSQIRDENNHATIYNYNNQGLLASVTDPESHSTTYQYDDLGNRTRTTDANNKATDFDYDAMNRLIKTTYPTGQGFEERTYDDNGNLLTLEDAEGRVTSYEYNPRNQLLKTTLPVIAGASATILQTYDPVGNKLKQTDARGHTTTYKYDLLNRVIEEKDPLNQITAYGYAGLSGNPLIAGSQSTPTSVTDKNGNTSTVELDTQYRKIKETDAEGNSTEYAYDPNSNLIGVQDAEDRVTTYEYNLVNRLVKTTNAHNEDKTFTYDDAGNKLSETNENGKTTTNVYDDANRLLEIHPPVIPAQAGIQIFSYDPVGNKLSSKDPNGNTTSYVYDSRNRLIRIDPPLSGDIEYTYDKVGNKLSETDENGNMTTFEFDARNRLTKTTGPDFVLETRTYDANNNALTVKDAENHTTSFVYDELNRKTETHPPVIPAQAGIQVFSYDPVGNKISETDPNNHVTTFEYNKVNKLTKTINALDGGTTYTLDKVYNVIAVKDPRDNTAETEYDGLNRPVKVTRPDNSYSETAYDAVGNILATRDWNGYVTQYEFDALNRKTKETDPYGKHLDFAYDPNGNLVSQKDKRGNETTHEYDARNRKTTTTLPGSPQAEIEFAYDNVGNLTSETDANNLTTSYQYDALNRRTHVIDARNQDTVTTFDKVGNVLTVTDRNGIVTKNEFDARNRLTQTTEDFGGLSKVTQFAYDAVGNRTRITDSNGEQTNFEYDALNRLTDHEFPDGESYRYQYDEMLNVTQKTTPNGNTITQTFDDLNRLISKNLGSEGSWTYTYDNNGNLLTANNPSASLEYQYDALNRVFQSDAAYIGATTRSTQYSWDFDGNPDQVLYPSNAVIDFTFDAQSRNTALTAHNGVIANNTFDAGSRLTSRTLNTGIVCNYAWDKLNRPLQSSDQALKLQWNFDNEANRLFERKAFGSTSTADHYNYDNLYRVTGTKYGVTSPLTTGTIGEANQPTAPAYSAVTGTKLEESTLDKEHNRITHSVDGGATSYSHDDRNRYTAVGGASITWDDNGNLLSDGTQKYVWDFENRLLEVRTQADALVVSYLYDAQGKRIAKVFPDGTKRYYYYDPSWNLLAEYNQAGTLVRETSNAGMDQYLSTTENLTALGINPVDLGYSAGTTSLDVVFHQNTIGNVLALTDTSANVIARYSYDVNGAASYLNASGAPLTGSALNAVKALNVSLFQGREFDTESGLYAFRNRFYSPTLGRFISTDPLDYVDGMNIYAFVNGNVVNMMDPLGLSEIDVHQYGTQWMAEKVGFEEKYAQKLGEATQALDQKHDKRNAMRSWKLFGFIPLPRWSAMRDHHFVDEQRMADLRSDAMKPDSTLKQRGEYIHAKQDGPTHTEGDEGYNPKKLYGGKDGGITGHAKAGHEPDQTWNNVEESMKSAEDTFNELVDLAKVSGIKPKYSSWGDLPQEDRDQYRKFVETPPETYTEYFGPKGVEDATATGYQEKISKLNPKYGESYKETEDFKERGEREAESRKHEERMKKIEEEQKKHPKGRHP